MSTGTEKETRSTGDVPQGSINQKQDTDKAFLSI